MEKGTLMAIPAMLAFDMDQTSGAEVGVFFKSNFNQRPLRIGDIACVPLSPSLILLPSDFGPHIVPR